MESMHFFHFFDFVKDLGKGGITYGGGGDLEPLNTLTEELMISTNTLADENRLKTLKDIH